MVILGRLIPNWVFLIAASKVISFRTVCVPCNLLVKTLVELVAKTELKFKLQFEESFCVYIYHQTIKTFFANIIQIQICLLWPVDLLKQMKILSFSNHANINLLIFLVKLLPFFQSQCKVTELSVCRIHRRLVGNGTTELICHFLLKVCTLWVFFFIFWILSTPLRREECFYKGCTKLTMWDLFFHYYLTL